MSPSDDREVIRSRLEELEQRTADDFESVEAPAALIELYARERDWPDLVRRAELIGADVAGRRGDVATQGQVAKRINQWAAEHGDAFLLARSHRLLAIFFRRIGDAAEALGHAVAGVRHADVMSPPLRCSQIITLALLLDLNGRFAEAERRFAEALDIAVAIGHAGLTLTILNNMAFTAYENEEFENANRLAEQMRRTASEAGLQLDGLYLDTLARICLAQGRHAEAERILEPVLRDPDGPLVSEGDSLPECLLTLAEIQAATGRVDEAGATLGEVSRLCGERGLAAVAARARQARAEWHAAGGRFREAYEEYRAFHEDSEALHSAQREARAYALHAVYEADEARRVSAGLREIAHRDALTGLFNRRHIDERLAAMVADAQRTGEPLSVAIVDLDHFKTINDTFSHAVGDMVLRELGSTLAGAVSGAECAARLGGEEFVLLLPGTGAEAAAVRCADLSSRIRAMDWAELTGAHRVTASIGVATDADGRMSAGELLAAADENMYAAKRAGRDRVVAGFAD
ncbi:GGDEF domain-containing protein [Actinoplanes subtropicus]|uniref:GGDEF domain-containing protein n=1 Tax=Actinoplanes subtropicus TaxID=543632 RepID=UPI0004C47662|nr:GGDEF domain-containing protein [Actinoplanes subtropicus]